MNRLSAIQESEILNAIVTESWECLGGGSSRLVFRMPQHWCDQYSGSQPAVAKVAIGAAGIRQNNTEITTFENKEDTSTYAEIFTTGSAVEIMEQVDSHEFRDLVDDYYDDDSAIESLQEEYDFSIQEATDIVDLINYLHDVFGFSSDNGQIGRTWDGRWVSYDYGFIPHIGCTTQCSDLSDYLECDDFHMRGYLLALSNLYGSADFVNHMDNILVSMAELERQYIRNFLDNDEEIL